ncbi:putative damage-inducible protein DinB [Aneurinibacillus soli]|uniref:DinB family protein n=1 Tax=Aneurinibacillus soli TaxID=1500254 RepID=A0A0U5AYC7_9BACL|nr:DinB family protein [Aneurinibacillus soli]PYE57376.1 putative damage-inducible protein DinB [Aneurinibacillus soli]BAU28773.1 DinB family protein [Aneurinibacillus soli]
MNNQAVQLYDYHTWANKRILEHVKNLQQEIYNKEAQGVFPSVSEALTHIYLMDALWLSVMSGDSFSTSIELLQQLSETTRGKSVHEMETAFLTLSERYKAFFEHKQNLDEAFSIEHPHFGRLETRLSELIQHVVNHGTYHRGQVTDMLRQLGHSGVSTDYVFYLYEKGRS